MEIKKFSNISLNIIKFFKKKSIPKILILKNLKVFKKKFFKIFYKNLNLFYIRGKFFKKFKYEICGTGGDLSKTFNISSSFFILLLLFGISCVKKGSNSYTSNSGSSEFINSIIKKKNFKSKFSFFFSYELFNLYRDSYLFRKKYKKISIFNYFYSIFNSFYVKKRFIGVYKCFFLKYIIKKNYNKKNNIFFSYDKLDEISLFNYSRIFSFIKKKKFTLIPFNIGFNIKNKINSITCSNSLESKKIFFNSFYKNKNSFKIIGINIIIFLFLNSIINNLEEGLFIFKKLKSKIFKKLLKFIYDINKNYRK
ncbi:hypothetical protein [Candidatus Vidania fulgoroideorum]